MFVKHLLHIGEKRREELIGGLPAQGAHREVVVLVHVSPELLVVVFQAVERFLCIEHFVVLVLGCECGLPELNNLL